jgi:hypothetical protein
MLERRGGGVGKFNASSRGFETLRGSFRTIAVMIRSGAFEFSKPFEKIEKFQHGPIIPCWFLHCVCKSTSHSQFKNTENEVL